MKTNPKLSKKSFSEWTHIEVEKAFGLTQHYSNDTLNEWLAANQAITSFETQLLERLREKAKIYMSVWNETDYMANFISNVFSLVDFNQIKYSSFYEQSVTIQLDDYSAKGRIDLMIAAGRGKPETPYFFMQEFKQEIGSGDPIAQVLLAMLFAQKQNKETTIPIYGGYVIGRSWFFMLLIGKSYVISDAFIATKQEDLFQIVRILKELRKRIDVKIGK